ncbi:MAG: AAA family ATPase [Carboxylicivirga sp.]|jgi:energy-coupling factor transporter ATP-binding protein EcfA2|nr:AAA family ATPase [Carboxylicivirga sp.]
MHLVYVYVENFENRVKNKEYNLSSKYTIHFNKETKYLEVKENEEYIDNFWPDNIYDIKAIVGENGCGKSTLLDILFSNSFEHRSFPNWDIPIFIFEGEGGIVVHKRKGYDVNIDPYITESPIDFSTNHFRYNENINSTTNVVYYSNLWDQENFNSDKEHIFNISTSQLVSLNQSITYKAFEFQRQIEYVTNNRTNTTSYIKNIPEYISVKITTDLYEILKYSTDDVTFDDILGTFIDTLDDFKEDNVTSILRKSFFSVLAKAYSLDIMPYKNEEMTPIWEYLTSNLSEEVSLVDIISEIKEIEKKISYKDKDNSVSNAIERFSSFEVKMKDAVVEILNSSMSVKFNEDFNDIYEEYLKSIPTYPYLEFSWREMSSGEKGLLALLSRFQYLKKLPAFKKANPNIEGQLSKDLIIIMDEVELYYHPNWQRKLIKILVNEIAPMFNGAKIQFIVASHSPFLISDLPRNNVIFLTNQEDGLATVVDPTGLDHTFGANIHELLANPFFMKSTLGDFSKEVISDLIKYTKGEKQERIKEDAIAQKLIDVIGEPVIKNKIQDMLNKRRHKTELIKFYKEQIIKLEKD